ncbi:MAG: hypothetical protein Q9228_005814 [Teloschistes exilis]
MDLEIHERDEAGNLTATYIGSSTDQGKNRLDIIYPTQTHNLWTRVLAVFLPAGYPHSVTEDYMWYQIYVSDLFPTLVAQQVLIERIRLGVCQDSLQAFSSSIAGLLSSRAVLQGVGVGDASANPTTALLLSILQESTGRIATILFADRLGTSLSPECKMYRLAADIFNDAAMLLDCLSPALPRGPRTLLLSTSSVLRALCGVTAGSSKASLSAHFAKWGNLGELNARANIVFSTFLDQGTVLSPKEVSLQERIFEWGGVLRWRRSSPLASAKIGHPLKDLLASLAPAHEKTGSVRDAEAKMMRLIRLYSQEEFLLWYDAPQRVGHIALKEGAAAKSQLKAWALILWITQRHRMDGSAEATSASFEFTLDLQRSSLQDLSSRWSDCIQRLRTAGWDIDVASLETTSGSRICVQG